MYTYVEDLLIGAKRTSLQLDMHTHTHTFISMRSLLTVILGSCGANNFFFIDISSSLFTKYGSPSRSLSITDVNQNFDFLTYKIALLQTGRLLP